MEMFKWDNSVLTDKNKGLLGMVCTAPTDEELQQAIDKVPQECAEFKDIMTTEATSQLPQHGPFDHEITFKPDTTPPWGPIYALNEHELTELRKWLKKMTDMGAVRISNSQCSSPMLFVPK